MEKVYLVKNDWSNESSGNIYMESIYVFKNYEKAKEKFNEIKEEIKSYDLRYSDIDDREDYYCEYESNEFLYYHELVMIEERKVEDYE